MIRPTEWHFDSDMVMIVMMLTMMMLMSYIITIYKENNDDDDREKKDTSDIDNDWIGNSISHQKGDI